MKQVLSQIEKSWGSILIKESNDEPPENSKLLEIPHAVELLECRSFFDNNGGKIKQSLSLISKRFDKHVEVRITGSLLYLYYDVSRSNRQACGKLRMCS